MSASWKITLAALACGLSLAGAPLTTVPKPLTSVQEPSNPPVRRPGAPKTPAFAYTLEPELISAVASKKVETGRRFFAEAARRSVGRLDKINRATFIPLAASWQFARYFSRVDALTDTQWVALQKLTTRPRFATRLMLGLGENDAPDHVLDVVEAICNEDGKNHNCDDWADLASALCVVWDMPAHSEDREVGKADVREAALLYRYYTNVAGRLQFDPKTLPFELLVYVVDNTVSRDDIAWAFDQYGRRTNVAGIYFDVPYDYDTLYLAGRHTINGQPLPLPDLRKLGGLCADQAYFATMVGRTLGVPSVTSTGRGSGTDGSGHAWVGYLDRNLKGVGWNFTDGRYEDQEYFRGDVIDPQSRRSVPESDIALSAESLHYSVDDRYTSSALLACMDLVDTSRKADLLMRAAALYPGNRAAWTALAQLGADRALSPAQAEQVASAVVKTMADPYPEFALNLLKQLNSGRGIEQQFTTLERMKNLFKNRPDLLADLALAQGDLRKAEHKSNEALQLYGSAFDGKYSMGPIVLAGMEKIDTLLSESRDTGRLADLYRAVWARMPSPDVTVLVRTTPYYLIGRRYATTLGELDSPAARAELTRVESKLESLESAVSTAER